MAHTLRPQLQQLAASFVESVLAAIRSASLEDVMSASGSSSGNAQSVRAQRTAGGPSSRSSVPSPNVTGRLPRRSPEQIAKTVEQLVALLKKHKAGLRAEQIRMELGLQAKEMPRILKEGLAGRKLKARGQKRATTYTAA